MSLDSLDPTLMFLGFVVGGIGFVLFVYGKKQQRVPQMAAGVAFMVYPYFADTLLLMLVIGAVIGAVLWWAIWAGY